MKVLPICLDDASGNTKASRHRIRFANFPHTDVKCSKLDNSYVFSFM